MQKENSLKKQTVSGILWSSLERFSVQGVQLVIGIIMARLLSPEEFGLIGMLAIFLAVSQSFIDSGFSNALIRKLDRTETDYSTVFYFNIVVGLIFYLLLFITAPFIADFYNQPILTSLTRVVAINLFISSMTVVQRAKLTINIDFKTQAKASFAAIIISGICGISLAYLGYGVWALAIQSIVNGFINMLALWWLTHWRPSWIFSWTSFRELFSFGSKLLASGLIDTIYRNIYLIVIGKVYSPADLGYYSCAHQYAQFPSSNLTGIMQRVTYPILSSIQNEDERLRSVYRQYLRLSAYIIFPLMIGLAALAEPVILLFLGEQWLPAALLLQLISLSMMWYPIHAINLNLLQVKGRSDLFLRLEIIKKILGVFILCITIPLGVAAMCAGSIISSLASLMINTYYTGKLIQVGFIKQMSDLVPILLLSFIMGGLVWGGTIFFNQQLFKLLVGIGIGIVFYLLLSYVFKVREYKLLLQLILKK